MQLLRYPEAGHIHPFPTGEDLLDRAVAPFRVWMPERPLLVIGASQNPALELHLTAAEADGIPVYRRRGGGGAVLLSAGCLCVALRLRRRTDLGPAAFFALGNGLIRDTLKREFNLATEARGLSDLAWNQRKVSGASLYMPRDCALYLASLLIEAPLSLWERHLRSPSREPDYRQGRAHRDFACNLRDLPEGAHLRAGVLQKKLEDRMALLPELDWPDAV